VSTRRKFLQVGAALGAGSLVRWQLDPTGGTLFQAARALASIGASQTPLSGKSVDQFVDALPTFAHRVGGGSINIGMQEFQQKLLPDKFYAGLSDATLQRGTYVWGYAVGNNLPQTPGVTVEVKRGTPTTVTYTNNLPVSGKLLSSDGKSLLTIDQTIHWADPLNNMGSTAPYAGSPTTVPHLHGAEVLSDYDGNPYAWFTPDGKHGIGYRTAATAAANAAVYQYPNVQPATTLWFHDHSLGITRVNVLAGLAAFYLVRDQYDTGAANNPLGLPAGAQEVELVIQDRQFDTNGQLYFPDSDSALGLNGGPPNPKVHPYWIPEFFGDTIMVNGKTWPFLKVEPRRYRFRFLNGSNARMYELRLMNRDTRAAGPAFWQLGTDGGLLDRPVKLNDPANNSAPRLFIAPGERADIIIDFSGMAGQTLNLVNSAKAPFPSGTSPDPQTTGQVMQFQVTAPLSGRDTTFNPVAGGALRGGKSQPPAIVRLANPTTGTLGAGVTATKKRQLVLVEVEGPGGPVEVLLNNTKWDGKRDLTGEPVPTGAKQTADVNGDYVTEMPRVGETELWEVVNTTADAHPIHLHLIQFQLMNRQSFNATQYRNLYDGSFPGGPGAGMQADGSWGPVTYQAGQFMPGFGPPKAYNTPNGDNAVGGNPAVTPYLQGSPSVPDGNEAGWKDTIRMLPGTVTRLVVRWAPEETAINAAKAGTNPFSFDPTKADSPGYVWHCHILDHEDNEMMRPLRPTF
jgi:spore coat protein A, manganese oxidase